MKFEVTEVDESVWEAQVGPCSPLGVNRTCVQKFVGFSYSPRHLFHVRLNITLRV
jgi:hypothetical protein